MSLYSTEDQPVVGFYQFYFEPKSEIEPVMNPIVPEIELPGVVTIKLGMQYKELQALGFQNGIRNVSSIRDFLGMKKVVCKAGDKRFDHMKIEMFKDEKTNKTKTNNEFKNLVNPLPTAAELLSSLKTETPKQAALPVGSEKVGDVVICKVVGSNNLGLSVELGSGKKGSVLTKSLLKPINQYKTDSLLTAKIQSDRFGLITLSEEKK